jgi:hypothetical protein
MSTKAHVNRAADAQRFQGLSHGITQHINAPVTLGNQAVTPQQMLAVFQAVAQTNTDLDAARSVAKAKLQARNTALAVARKLALALEAYLVVTYGKDNPVLADFGIVVQQALPKTPEVKALAAAKAKATRAARHTMGPRQKAAIHGEVAPVATPPAGKPSGS